MSLELGPFAAERASADELRAWYDLSVTSAAADYPSNPVPPYDSYVQQLCKPTSYLGLQRLWVARDKGRLVAPRLDRGTGTAVRGQDARDRRIASVRRSR
ncbi:hypothetical protein [Streptomyces chattanoogensis]|uniref:hypothetical protein n=1 Tax=Streptomyces chattanoogensis TaxID=66876 RepID=UPI0036C0B3D2